MRMMGGLHLISPNQTQTRKALRHQGADGFTIVESLIVLAVTGILFASAVAIISGKQNKTQFQQGINAVKTEIEQTVSDVQSGYYPNAKNFSCAIGAGGTLTISDKESDSATDQGSNKDCVFLGKAIQFRVSEDNYVIFSIAGQRTATSLSTTGAQAIGQAVETKMLPYGITPKWVRPAGTTSGSVGAVAFVTSFGGTEGDVRGSPSIQLVPVPGSGLGDTTDEARATVNGNLAQSSTQPVNGIKVCYESGTTNQHGIVSVTGGGAVSLIVNNGGCPA